MNTSTRILILAFVWAALLAFDASAQPGPHPITYQMRFTLPNGQPVPDSIHTATLTIYDSPTPIVGSRALWSETQTVPTSGGVATFYLGMTHEPTDPYHGIDFTRPLWLGVSLDAGVDLVPRTQLGGSPFAHASDTAIHAGIATYAAIAGALASPITGLTQVGDLKLWSGIGSPDAGWLRCKGDTLKISTDTALFQTIGQKFTTALTTLEQGTWFQAPNFTDPLPGVRYYVRRR